MRDLAGGDFPDVHPHLMKKLCTRRVKRRGKKFDMVFLAAGDQFRIHFKREHQLGAHLQLAFRSGRVSRICLLIFGFFRKNRNIKFRDPGLEFDKISTRSCCRLYHFLGDSDISVVVYAGFRDNCNAFVHPRFLLARRNSTSARSSSLSISTLFFLSINRA